MAKGKLRPGHNQILGNAGLHYVAYYLSRREWGVDLIIYGSTGKPKSVQIKAVTGKNSTKASRASVGVADFWVICSFSPGEERRIEPPTCFILDDREIGEIMERRGKEFIDYKEFNQPRFKNRWDRLGEPYP
jgi:hypothetical protein